MLDRTLAAFIKMISDATGWCLEPTQIRRIGEAKNEVQAQEIITKAEAEAKAKKIHALAKIKTAELECREPVSEYSMDVSELERRGLVRMVREEGKKQANIENITYKAIPHLNECSKPEQVERDWLTYFFDSARLISDNDMQMLWAKILAGEANAPGAFSKRTLDFVKTLSREDAELFTKFGTFVWMDEDHPVPLIWGPTEDDVFWCAGIYLDVLKHLETIELISYESGGYFNSKPGDAVISYYEKSITINTTGKDITLAVGNVILTQIGRELFPICDAKPNEEYFQYVVERIQGQGLSVTLGESSSSSEQIV